ncbi:MAG: EAL domain-containing protein [Treponema sp.]|nr:EAL domain-containing protein [Treponema sp.]
MINNKFKDVGLDTKRHNIIIKIFYAILFAVICFLCFLQIKLDSKNTLNFLLSAFIIVGLLILLLYQENMRKRLYKSAYFDDVIDGENLKYMQYYVEKELKKNPDVNYCIAYIDMVKFKLINDKFGHEISTEALKNIFTMLKKSLSSGEFVARIVGDEFLIFMKFISNTETKNRLKVVMDAISVYGRKELQQTNIIFRVGIYKITDKSMYFHKMMDRANMAQYTLAQQGGYETKYAFYNEDTRHSLKRDYEIQQKMQTSFDHKEFEVYLQPKYNIQTNTLQGAEALIRWNHDEWGMLYPASFISIFEYNGFIVKIDRFVFRQVCRYIRSWLDAGYDFGVISVNLSKAHFLEPNFLDEFEKIRKEYDVPSKYIEFELTESLVFQNMTLLFDLTEELHLLGYKCSLDDFGSGYSSLNVLKNIPVDVLKLDRCFFTGKYDVRSRQVINGIISLTHDLGIKTVAEGVETSSQIEFLKEIGCDAVQTFIYAKPMPINEYRLFADKFMTTKDVT